jgi:type IV pilus assembly protein PilW
MRYANVHEGAVDGRREQPDQNGFTLTEVMIATAMTAAILAAGFAAVTITQKTTRSTSQVGQTQATVRNALDMIAADLKVAGFGLQGLIGAGGGPGTVGGCRINNTPVAVVPTDNNPAGPDTGPDRISIVVPMTNSVAAAGPLWQVSVPPAGTIGGPNSPITNVPLPAGAITAMEQVVGGAALLPGMSVSIAGTAGSVIQNAAGGGLVLNPPIPAPVQFGTGTQVYLLQCITYQVIPPPDNLNLCQGNAPCLVRGAVPSGLVPAGMAPNCNQAGSTCVPIMDGVEDLQLAYACDGCSPLVNGGNPDGQIDDLNGSNSFDQGDFITNRDWFGTAAPFGTYMTPDKIKLVRVTLVARQLTPDQGFGEATQVVAHTGLSSGAMGGGINGGILTVSDHNHADGLFVAGDNGTPAQQQSYLQFRRRILTRTVELRNQRY